MFISIWQPSLAKACKHAEKPAGSCLHRQTSLLRVWSKEAKTEKEERELKEAQHVSKTGRSAERVAALHA